MAAKKRKTDIRGSISRFVIVALVLVLVLALAIWAIISLFTGSKEKTRYAFLNMGSINETLTTDFILLRDETLILAESEGIFLPLTSEGERLSKGEVYALVLPESAAGLVDSYRNIKVDILERSLLLSQSDVKPNSRLTLIQELIREAVSDLRAAVFSDDIGALALAQKKLDAALEQRSVLLKPESINDTELNSLLSQEAALLRQLTDTAPAEGVLRTANPCWISYTTFAATPKLAKEDLSGLTLQQTQELVNNIDLYEKTNKQPAIVQKGDPLARCVNSMEYNLIALLPDYALRTESDNFSISVNERSLLLDDITILQKAVDTDTVLALQTKAVFGDLLDGQIIRQADLLIRSHSGIKVPLQSLYDYSETDHIARLLKVSDGITKEVIVFVQAEDDTHAIIEGRTGDSEAPAENDLYVLNPWTGSPGSLLE
ncbi:MAG: hypothetical protein GX763_02955 [Clostridiaceae bacterium]|nr:hypothetical protein [Clostridiaceae bacterium]